MGPQVLDDPLHMQSPPATWWSTVNVAEAIPGVPTPLGWTFWTEAMEWAAQWSFWDLGVISRAARDPHPPIERCFAAIFFGRAAINLDTMRLVSDHMPGTTPERFEEQFFGSVAPSDVEHHPTRGRYLVVALKLPLGVALLSRRLARIRADANRFWCASVVRELGEEESRALLGQARDRFKPVVRRHAFATLLAQAVYEQVRRLAKDAGCDGLESSIVSGYGGLEEAIVVRDLWDVSRDRLALDQFVARHGYHGPAEGELSSRSWREGSDPVRSLAQAYRSMGVDDAPSALEARAAHEREVAEQRILAALRRRERLRARLVMGMARRFVPLREVGKTAFLQVLDVVRFAARGVGAGLARRGLLDEPDDVFFLTLEEVLGSEPPSDARALVELRRARWSTYRGLEIPSRFRGQPIAVPVRAVAAAAVGERVEGLAVAPGVVEGTARVLLEADEAEPLEPGDVLVTRITDPSWTSLFLTAGALVIDIGGVLSHGAIAARELGIPCVIGTGDGTRRLRSGDRVRVDGLSGIVEVLARGTVGAEEIPR